MSEGNEFSSGKKGLLEVDEVAGYLGVTPVTVYRWCRDGSLPCLKVGRSWRIRRQALADFLRGGERPVTLTGRLRAFLEVPDSVIGVAQTPELLHRLDAAFFRVGEASGALLVKFHGGEPQVPGDELLAELERNGLEASRLEEEGRLRLSAERGPTEERNEALEKLLEEELDPGQAIWVSFNWAENIKLEAALRQQNALRKFVNDKRLVVKTAVMEEVFGDWPLDIRREAQETHSGMVWLSNAGLALSRITPLPSE